MARRGPVLRVRRPGRPGRRDRDGRAQRRVRRTRRAAHRHRLRAGRRRVRRRRPWPTLLRAKGRGRDMPVPVLVGSWATIDGLVSTVDARTRDLIEAFWPGGLTLVVRHAPSLTWDLGDARGTVAVRMPLHPVAIELLEKTGPMAVSSANRHGQPPAQTAAEARAQLGEDVAVYLEDGQVARRRRLDDRRRHRRPAADPARRGARAPTSCARSSRTSSEPPTVRHPDAWSTCSSPAWRRRSASCSRRWPAGSRSASRRSPSRATATCTPSPPRGWAASPLFAGFALALFVATRLPTLQRVVPERPGDGLGGHRRRGHLRRRASSTTATSSTR